MKKVITVILAIALLAALALPAVADAFTLYVTRSGVRVYAKKSTSSEVYHKLSKGQKVLIEKKSGSWYAILVEDPEGGQTLGWVQAKYLSTTKPSRKKKSSQSTPATVTPSSTKEIERVLGTMREVEPYDAQVVTKTEKGTVALRWQLVALPLAAVVTVCNMTLQTSGQSVSANILAAARNGIFFIPLILILPRILGLKGVEICQAVCDILAFILAIPLTINFFRFTLRKKTSTSLS